MGKSLLVKLVGVAVAIVVAIGVSFALRKGNEKIEEAKAPKVGECINVDGTVNAKHKDIDCGADTATYKVAADDGDCDPSETTYKISLGGKSANVADLCLIFNAVAGDCFRMDPTSAEKLPCAEGKGDISVLKIASVGKAKDTCATPGQPLVNKKRDTVLCLVPNA